MELMYLLSRASLSDVLHINACLALTKSWAFYYSESKTGRALSRKKKLNVSKILCTNTIFVQTAARSEKSAHSFVTHINNFVVVRVIIECWLEESLFLNLLTILRVKFIVYIP